MPAITSGSFKIHLRIWKPAKFLSSVNAAFLFPSPHQMASDHPCNSVLELSSQWVSLLVKSSMVLPSKLDTKWAVTPSKNKPLKLVNLWCIPTAKVPVQECRGLSTGLGSIWWYIWLTSPAKATSSFLNLTKMSTISLCNLLPGSDSLFKLSVLLSWAIEMNPNFGCGLLWSHHREMQKEPFWWWFQLFLWDFSDISFT